MQTESPMTIIKAQNGAEILIDAENFDVFSRWVWRTSSGYACASLFDRTTKKAFDFKMHRIVANTPDGFDTDHINGNTLDNRRANLRVCSHAENMRNRRTGRNNKLGLKGVHQRHGCSTFRAMIYVNRKKIDLGSFSDMAAAAEAYDRAALAYHGIFAQTNNSMREAK